MSLLLVSFTWETPRMSISLIESERRSQKSLGGTFVSVALHASLITIAVYASANAGEVKPTTPVVTEITFFPRQPVETARKHEGSSQPRPKTKAAPPRAAQLGFSPHISDSLPSIDSPAVAPAESLFSGRGSAGASNGVDSSSGSGTGEPMLASQVEKPAVPREGNPIPKYPSLLESSRVEGQVLVQFVVDTLGRIDMRSFTVLESTNELFAQSLQATLPRWRFYPAEAGGRKVKQMVQLPLKFIAPRR
jgi:periplasmic protein TonB